MCAASAVPYFPCRYHFVTHLPLDYCLISLLHGQSFLSTNNCVTKVLKIKNIYATYNVDLQKVICMAVDNVQNSFRRGVMTLVILALLKKEDMYGYQLVQQTLSASGGRIITQEGSLYPVLYKLLDQGLISDRKVQVGKRMTRVYYHLEPAGETRLQELIREYEEITTGIHLIVEGERE